MTPKLHRPDFPGLIPSFLTLLLLSIAFPALAQSGNAGQKISGNALGSAPSTVNTQMLPLRFAKAVSYSSGADLANSVAVGDVNGDGYPDIVVVNPCNNPNCFSGYNGIGQIGVLLGNGDGTFQDAEVYNSGGYDAYAVALGDVNGDGYQDVVVTNLYGDPDAYLNGNVSILAGSCCGLYPPASYDAGGFPEGVAIADLNGDGHPDIILTPGYGVGVMLWNGGGFQPVVIYPAGWPISVAVADVNGDGKPDIIGVDESSYAVDVLLGNGDGTFQLPLAYPTVIDHPISVAVADLNGDGKPDIVVSGGLFSGSMAVLLGNGDGSFQPARVYPAVGPSGSISVAIGDLNGDGYPDIVATGYCQISNCNNGEVAVFLGKGDGTFRAPVHLNSGGAVTSSVAIADVNGDGKPDLIVANECTNSSCMWDAAAGVVGVLLNDSGFATTTRISSSLNPSLIGEPITFTATITSNPAISDGRSVIFYSGKTAIGTGLTKSGVAKLTASSLPIGSHAIKAVYPGDLKHQSSSGTATEVVNGYATSTSLGSNENPSIYGQKVRFTATVTSAGGLVPTGTVLFSWSNGTQNFAIGTAPLNNSGIATLTVSHLNAGAYPLTAVYKGDANNISSTSQIISQTVVRTMSTATITSNPNPSTSGQIVSFTAKVATPTVVPDAWVTFKMGTTVLGRAELDGDGRAALNTSSLPQGSNVVKVTYSGNSNIKESSASLTQIVQP